MQTVFQRSFAGGELAPALGARADLLTYAAGLRTCRNFIVRRHGGVSNRPGTRYVGPTRDSSTATFLLRYVSEIAGESVLLEAGPYYLRVYQAGALVRLTGVAAYNGGILYAVGAIVRQGGVNYYARVAHTAHATSDPVYWYPMPGDILEIPTPFGNGAFFWVQSGRVITMTSSAVAPHELIYRSLTEWALQPVQTAAAQPPPTALVVTAGVAGTRQVQYIVTAAAADTYEESIGSAIGQALGVGEPTPDAPHVVTWTAAAGAPPEYYVYKDPYGNGVFGYVGTATGLTSFRDVGFVPDFAVTPPRPRILFAAVGDYPARAAYYQQRRFFAHTVHEPDSVWGSRTGFPSNFTLSSPLQDDDALTFRIAGNQANPIRHLLGLKSLIVLTDGAVWTVGQPKQPLTPSQLPADAETYVGVSDAPPVVIGNAILYMQTRGSILRDVQFSQEVEGLAGRDLTLWAAHLVDGFRIDRLDYQTTPHSIVWACRSDGTLLGLTYVREQEVAGWHRHDSGAHARFEDVCVVPEHEQDAVYVLVRRTIAGQFVRSIERLESRSVLEWIPDSFFVDAGLTYSGPPVTTIRGLDHLEGELVAVVADGVVLSRGDPTAPNAANFRVTGGTIAGPIPAARVIHAGLPIHAEIETLDLDVAGREGRDVKKRPGSVSLLLERSARTFWVGPDADHLRQVQVHPWEQAAASFTGQVAVNITADYSTDVRVVVRQVDPLPLTVLGVLPRIEPGG